MSTDTKELVALNALTGKTVGGVVGVENVDNGFIMKFTDGTQLQWRALEWKAWRGNDWNARGPVDDIPLPPPVDPLDRKVTVCAECLQASCWREAFMCDDAQWAATVNKTVRELTELGYENPQYWEKDIAGAVAEDPRSKSQSEVTQVELCIKLMTYVAFSSHTADMTPRELWRHIAVLFPTSVIDAARVKLGLEEE